MRRTPTLPSVVDMDLRDAHRPDQPSTTSAAPPPDSAAALPPRWPGWARTLLAIMLMLPCAMAGTVLLLVPGYTGLLEHPAMTVQVAGYAPFAATVLAAYLLVSWALLRWVDRRPFGALGLRLDRRALLGLLVGCGIALLNGLVAAGAVQALGLARGAASAGWDGPVKEAGVLTALAMGAARAGWAGPVREAGVLTGLAMVLFIVLRAFVLLGIGEEVRFRGYLMQSLRRRPVLAVLVAAVAFTIPHLLSNGGQQSPF